MLEDGCLLACHLDWLIASWYDQSWGAFVEKRKLFVQLVLLTTNDSLIDRFLTCSSLVCCHWLGLLRCCSCLRNLARVVDEFCFAVSWR